jgi:hypothetical protein
VYHEGGCPGAAKRHCSTTAAAAATFAVTIGLDNEFDDSNAEPAAGRCLLPGLIVAGAIIGFRSMPLSGAFGRKKQARTQ